ncbi:DinB family protein [Mucilaginibacter yixingensis]|uniref:DinB family protein n=1 Tax=Mucilaginibacter yixingensis TaxID=1295612 RepID=A0A2T5JCR9_9SPHI|nr:DinB family protein [Mucilaginibacter yixingensis]PTQ99561.1 DinB family protein [Mucilaginibacter yixingensis]
MIAKPQPNEYAAFAETYINRAIVFDDVVAALANQQPETVKLFTGLYAAKGNYRYADDKWTLKEVLLHMIDTERVFAYRAMCVARDEQQNLPGFSENDYTANGNADAREMTDLLEEYKAVRAASVWLLRSLTTEQADRIGSANGRPVSVRALAYMMLGHELHHAHILKERYA